jgi:hypothetical protein
MSLMQLKSILGKRYLQLVKLTRKARCTECWMFQLVTVPKLNCKELTKMLAKLLPKMNSKKQSTFPKGFGLGQNYSVKWRPGTKLQR